MHTNRTAPLTTTLPAYSTYLRSVLERNRDCTGSFDGESCGAFIQDNFPLALAASFEQVKGIFGSVTFLSPRPDTPGLDYQRASFEVLPHSEGNPIVVQLVGLTIPDILTHCPQADPAVYRTTASFHGGGSNGGNRSYELVGAIANVLELIQREQVGCIVPFCHIEDRRHRMG